MIWYDYVFGSTLLVVVLQLLISFVFGELDMDVDTDGDLDVGDVFSFKGGLHFIMGASATLTAFREVTTTSVLIALVVGILFAVGLYYLYKLLYTKLTQVMKYTEVLENVRAEVYYWNKSQKEGQVFVILEGRKLPVDIESEDEIDLVAGQNIQVSGTRHLVHKV